MPWHGACECGGSGVTYRAVTPTLCAPLPLQVWAQMGSGSVVSLLTLAGGVTAGAVHGIFAEQLSPLTTAKPIERGKVSATTPHMRIRTVGRLGPQRRGVQV